MTTNVAKSFDTLAISLNVLCNYFDSSTKVKCLTKVLTALLTTLEFPT